NWGGIAVDNHGVSAPVRVVVADDDDVLRDLLVLNLESEGIEVHEARDGAEALRRIVEERPDLVVLDVMMPVHDGLAVLRRLMVAGTLRSRGVATTKGGAVHRHHPGCPADSARRGPRHRPGLGRGRG